MSQYTQEAFDDLQKSIKTVTESLAEARLRMGASAQADTWHDNAAFDQASEDVRNLQAQLAQLTKARNDAEVVEQSDSGTIGIGSKVTVKYDDGDIETLIVDGRSMNVISDGDNEVMRVSTSSPVGAALIGRHAGDAVSYAVPNGGTMTLDIVEVA